MPERLPELARLITAVWRGDWATFARAAAAVRAAGAPRSDLEETVLQAVLFCGIPRVVTAFEKLGEAWPAAAVPCGGGLPRDEQAAAGSALFTAIYGRNDASVRRMLRSGHGEFHDFVLEVAYGRILARPALSPHDREVLACAALAAQGQKRQFVAHARGAGHFGASKETLTRAIEAAFDGCDERADPWLALLR